ncbi:hypothetical protein TNCT_389941 [Trichonephila clavata]|uniref:Uncharacterized protein n=1 Tax=Trichonephila clavata TaxID=2740835 RepID=A0A8X6GF13_TRICU|nr:hypothetical protein TNCT_389941 [Trichonephila clavata]
MRDWNSSRDDGVLGACHCLQITGMFPKIMLPDENSSAIEIFPFSISQFIFIRFSQQMNRPTHYKLRIHTGTVNASSTVERPFSIYTFLILLCLTSF